MEHAQQVADLAALRAALNSGSHWLIILDDLHANHRIRREALKHDWVLAPGYIFGCVEFVNPLTLRGTPFCYMGVPKTCLSQEGMFAFLGEKPPGASADQDMFVDGHDVPQLLEIIGRVRAGDVTLPSDARSN